MKILVIMANPRKNSYTRRLLQAFLSSYRQHHPADTVTELDLYQADIPVIDSAVIQAWDKAGQGLSPEEQQLLAKVDPYTEQFVTADKIVFAAPMWNLQFPPLLTAYLASIMVAGKTFCYTETGCKGLLPDKPVLLLHVRGGIYSSGPMQAFDHAVPYLRDLCGMMGLTRFQTVIYEGGEMFPDRTEQLLQQALLQAANLAEHF